MKRSYEFSNIIARLPGRSVAAGLRDGSGVDPDVTRFAEQHAVYLELLSDLGVQISVLESLDEFPDSVFVEDVALCIGDTAIVLRPGAQSRAGEPAAIRPALSSTFERVIELPGTGTLDGGDVLLAEAEAFVGLSARTSQAGIDALAEVLMQLGYQLRQVDTPASILHFKTACGLLDESTVFATRELAETGCFDGYRIIEAVPGEEAAANLIRVNRAVLCRDGFPQTHTTLKNAGYQVVKIDTSEAAKIDGGLSCMSLRFNLGFTPA